MMISTLRPRTLSVRKRVLFLSTVLCAGFAPPIHAQPVGGPGGSGGDTLPAGMNNDRRMRFETVDENGVDIVEGRIHIRIEEGAIGSGDARLSMERDYGLIGRPDNWPGQLIKRPYSNLTTQDAILLRLASGTVKFNHVNGAYIPENSDGATLVELDGGARYLYTSSDGVKITYGAPTVVYTPSPVYGGGYLPCTTTSLQCVLAPLTIIKPSGMRYDLTWKQAIVTVKNYYRDGTSAHVGLDRLERVVSSAGYQMDITYVDPSITTPPKVGSNWFRRQSVVFKNNRVSSPTWPTTNYSYTSYPAPPATSVTDIAGRTWTFGTSTYGDTSNITSVTRPGASSPTTTISRDANGRVNSVTKDGATTTYAWAGSGTTRTATIGHPLGGQSVIGIDQLLSRVTTVRDQLNRTTAYTYDSSARPTGVVFPEGNSISVVYDARGNATHTTYSAKPGAGLSDITLSATFPANCTSQVVCNKPSSTVDARGGITTFVYDQTTGLPTKITLPAATSGGVRPETRFGYSTTNGVSVLTSISQCTMAASCSGGANERKELIAYNSNLLPKSRTLSSGNNAITAVDAFTYDAIGNLTYIDGPLTGPGDTTRRIYDAGRQLIGVVGPDPDGAGPRSPVARRISYGADGQVTKVEMGTVANQTDTAWSAFSSYQQEVTSYDSNARPVRIEWRAGGATFSVSEFGYDMRGRQVCAAQRMSPSMWSTVSDPCAPQTTGVYGPDRVTKTVYDTADQVVQILKGVGTSLEIEDVSISYTPNGKQATLTDAEGNKTTYEYDGFDRLRKTRYPSPAQGAGTSSITDYEQFTYDAASNVTQRRLRDGQTVTLGYDGLGRVISMTGTTINSRVLSYDLLNRPLSITYSTGGQSVANTWDALGRLRGQSTPQGTVGYQYDAAGRRTRISWPDAFYVQYDYDVLGRTTKVRENGASSGVGVLASYTYDALGRPSSVIYGNGTSRVYAYDNASRLTGLKLDLAGSSGDLTLGKVGSLGSPISYNPASQIISLVRSNDAYAWDAHVNVDRAYAANGRNQYTAIGNNPLGYDVRGNLTASAGVSYAYDGLNQLITLSGAISASLSYDPVGRLYQLTSDTGISRFLYDGGMMIAEYSGANVLRNRYVPGPNIDEPIVWYEGAGTVNRRFLQADERGSIIAVSNASGGLVAANAYDEYGIPGGGNLGRFGYTGQLWLNEIGLSYYKARMYSPTLGRFMQTDPIGYSDGMNVYAYVGNDPVNFSDPTGLFKPGWSKSCGGVSTGCGGSPGSTDGLSASGDIVVTGTRNRSSIVSSVLGLGPLVYAPTSPLLAIGQGAAALAAQGSMSSCSGMQGFEQFELAAQIAISANPVRKTIPGWLRGIFIHSAFSAIVQTFEAPGYSAHVNVSYKDGQLAGWLDFGTSRPDAVWGHPDAPSFVVELKTGNARLRNPQLAKYRRNLPPGTVICEIYERSS